MYIVDELCSLPGNSIEEIADGDFAADANVAILTEKPIVITNPPWSIFRKFFKLLTDNDVDMLIVGNINAVAYMDVFYFIRDGLVKVSTNRCSVFTTEHMVQHIGQGSWFTTFVEAQRPDLVLTGTYSPEKYPKLDNYDAILVNRTKDIPIDYDGIMAVPKSYAGKHDSRLFEIVGVTKKYDMKYTKSYIGYKQSGGLHDGEPFKRHDIPMLKNKPWQRNGVYYTNGTDCIIAIYDRLLIRRRKPT